MTENVEQNVYQACGRIVVRRIGEDRLLVPVSGGVAMENAVFPVNETGLFVWEQLTAGKNIQETAQKMTEVFKVDLETAQNDCKEITKTFLDQKLIEKAEKREKN